MKFKITIVLISLTLAAYIMSGGYAYWQDYIVIDQNITITEPETELEESAESSSEEVEEEFANGITDPKMDNIGEENLGKLELEVILEDGIGTDVELEEGGLDNIDTVTFDEDIVIPDNNQ